MQEKLETKFYLLWTKDRGPGQCKLCFSTAAMQCSAFLWLSSLENGKLLKKLFLCGITYKLWTDENWVLNCQFSLHAGKIPTHWVDIFFETAFFFCTCVFMRFLFSMFILSYCDPYIDNRYFVKKDEYMKIWLPFSKAIVSNNKSAIAAYENFPFSSLPLIMKFS